MADCSIFASGWVADGGAALPVKLPLALPPQSHSAALKKCDL